MSTYLFSSGCDGWSGGASCVGSGKGSTSSGITLRPPPPAVRKPGGGVSWLGSPMTPPVSAERATFLLRFACEEGLGFRGAAFSAEDRTGWAGGGRCRAPLVYGTDGRAVVPAPIEEGWTPAPAPGTYGRATLVTPFGSVVCDMGGRGALGGAAWAAIGIVGVVGACGRDNGDDAAAGTRGTAYTWPDVLVPAEDPGASGALDTPGAPRSCSRAGSVSC